MVGHVEALSEVFCRIREAKLKIKPPKCSFAKTGIHYLGFIISADGVQCDPAITEKVQSFSKPISKKEVRSFLGLTSYYRRFILNYAFIAKPLHDLTKDDSKFLFEKEHEMAFEKLKEALVSPPVLAFPDFKSRSSFRQTPADMVSDVSSNNWTKTSAKESSHTPAEF